VVVSTVLLPIVRKLAPNGVYVHVDGQLGGRIVGLSEAYRLDSRDAGGGRGVEVRLKSDATVSSSRGYENDQGLT
jgi:hypothetical protein